MLPLCPAICQACSRAPRALSNHRQAQGLESCIKPRAMGVAGDIHRESQTRLPQASWIHRVSSQMDAASLGGQHLTIPTTHFFSQHRWNPFVYFVIIYWLPTLCQETGDWEYHNEDNRQKSPPGRGQTWTINMINDKLLRKWEMDSKQMETWSLLDQETGRRGGRRRIFWILLVYVICPERVHTKINR